MLQIPSRKLNSTERKSAATKRHPSNMGEDSMRSTRRTHEHFRDQGERLDFLHAVRIYKAIQRAIAEYAADEDTKSPEARHAAKALREAEATIYRMLPFGESAAFVYKGEIFLRAPGRRVVTLEARMVAASTHDEMFIAVKKDLPNGGLELSWVPKTSDDPMGAQLPKGYTRY